MGWIHSAAQLLRESGQFQSQLMFACPTAIGVMFWLGGRVGWSAGSAQTAGARCGWCAPRLIGISARGLFGGRSCGLRLLRLRGEAETETVRGVGGQIRNPP